MSETKTEIVVYGGPERAELTARGEPAPPATPRRSSGKSRVRREGIPCLLDHMHGTRGGEGAHAVRTSNDVRSGSCCRAASANSRPPGRRTLSP